MAKTNAERQREWRQRQKRLREAEEAAAPPAGTATDLVEPSAEKPPSSKKRRHPIDMRAEVDLALAAMKWLVDSDKALVALARQCGDQINAFSVSPDPKVFMRTFQVQQNLTRILHELGGTPTVRMQHELRSQRLRSPGPIPEDTDASEAGSAEAEGGVVTRFQRPPKRSRG